jgi:hypothetical protein
VELLSTATTPPSASLEELERHPSALLELESAWESSRESVSALVTRRGVVGVVSIVETGTEFGIGQNLIRFVNGGHLGFAPAFVGVCLECRFPAAPKEPKLDIGQDVVRAMILTRPF